VQTSAPQLAELLSGYRFRYDCEKDLQDGIARILTEVGVPFEREVTLGDAGRIDFVVDGRVGVEVKIKGALTAMTIQVHKYTRQDAIEELLIATTRSQLRRVPDHMNGKRVVVAWLGGGAF
jgi:hypothetical protein